MAPPHLSLLSEYRYEPFMLTDNHILSEERKLTFLYVVLGIESIHAKNTLYHWATPQLKVKFL